MARADALVEAPAGKVPRRNAMFPVGVNYYPLDTEAMGWEDWYQRDFDADFAAFSEARFALVRLFVSWKKLEPQVGQYDEDALEHFAEVLSAARENRLQAIVCFFADDRHAEMVDVPWGKRRDPLTDPYLISREVALVQRVVNRFRGEPVVFGWDLANEAFASGFQSAEAFSTWTRTLRESIREIDSERPIIVSVDPEAFCRHRSVDAIPAIDQCEFAVSHATASYRAYAAEGPITSGPGTYLDSFLVHSAARDLPVLMDDVGVFSLDNSPAEEAAYLRTVLYSGLMNGAAGVLLRRYRDLDIECREPYYRDPFEILVGVADVAGRPKPACAEASAFVRVAARVDLRRYTLIHARTAILIPAERYEPLPNLAGLYDPRACLQAYISAKEAHIPVTIARENDDLGAYSVIVVPGAFRLGADTWARLAEFVQQGGSLVLSYGGGDPDPAMRGIFGVEFLGDGGNRSKLSCRIAQPDVLGSLRAFDAPIELPCYALLGHGGATVVATDHRGSPLLTLNQFGQGRAVCIAAPLERAIAQGDAWAAPEPVTELLREVYGAVARTAGCGTPVECGEPAVELALFNGDEDDILLLLNHGPTKRTAHLTFERFVASISDVRGGTPVEVGSTTFGVPLEPNGVATLRLAYK